MKHTINNVNEKINLKKQLHLLHIDNIKKISNIHIHQA